MTAGTTPPTSRQVYDVIGVGYGSKRRPDPRLSAAINEAVGPAATVLNVGAVRSLGRVPRTVPRHAHPTSWGPACAGSRRATSLRRRIVRCGLGDFNRAPLGRSQHRPRGITSGSETPGPIYLGPRSRTEAMDHNGLRAIDELETSRFVSLESVVDALGAHSVQPFEIPHDFTDGFQAAFWRRPSMYLDPEVRAASSTFASLPPELVEPGIERLRSDLRTGKWQKTYGELLALDSADFGHRIVIAG
jgi:hypothetical protein